MAVPTYFGSSQGAGLSGASISPVASTAVDDILILAVESANETVATPTGQTGFVQVTGSPQATGVAGATTAVALTVFWKRCAVAGDTTTAVVVADPGDHMSAVLASIRGCVTTGDPWNVTAGDVEAAGSSSVTWPSVTTTVSDCLILNILANAFDSLTAQFSGQSNGALSGLAESADFNTNAGNGGGISIVTGGKAVAGVVGTTTGSLANSVVQGRLTIAMKSTTSVSATVSVPPMFSRPLRIWQKRA